MRRALLLFLLLLPVTVHAQTSVIVRGKISTANATTTPLAGNATFTGGWELARDYTTLTLAVFSDKASATNGLEVQWSSDAVNVDVVDAYSITANVGASWTTVAKGIYYRVVYTNGATTQTAFRLSAILRQSGAPGYTDTGSGGLTDAELRATPVPVSGTVTATPTGTQAVSGTVTANAGTGPWPITDNGGSVTVDGTFWQATQPISGTVTANAGTGTMAVSGPVTDAQLRATPVPVSGTVTANVGTGTQPVSGTVTVTDGAGALNVIVDSGTTAATQSGTWTVQPGNTANTVAWKVDGSAVTQPVSGTFWQATQPVSGTFWQATQPVSGTVTTTPPANQSVNQTQVNGVAVAVGNGPVDTGTQRVSLAQRVTYAASTTAKTATAAGTGPFFTICGSATKTIRIQQFIVSGTVATAAVWGDVVLKKTSAATSAGTATALTKVPLDSSSAAATANAVNYYTALATAGTLVGSIAAQTQLFPVTAISATLQPTPAPMEFKWRDQDSESPVLRGTAQCMEANFGTTTTNAPTLAVSVKWTEE